MNNYLLLFLSLAFINPVLSQSSLLESVKKNPADAIKMCNKFKELNSKGISGKKSNISGPIASPAVYPTRTRLSPSAFLSGL